MGSQFSLVQYSPNLLGEERITLGMVAVDEDDANCAWVFTNNWTRIKDFADCPVKALQDTCAQLASHLGQRGPMPETRFSVAELKEMAVTWQHNIRVTPPEYADIAATEWVRDFAPLYVRGVDYVRDVKAGKPERSDFVKATQKIIRESLVAEFQVRHPEQYVIQIELPTDSGAMRSVDAAIVTPRAKHLTLVTTLDHELAIGQLHVDSCVRTVQELRSQYGLPMLVVLDPESHRSISETDRAKLTNQLNLYCGKEKVPVVGLDQPDEIRSNVVAFLPVEARSVLLALPAD